MEIKVLDKGYVKLINAMGTDMSPIFDARISTSSEANPERDDKLREYLWKNQHTSVFESLIAQIEIKIPLFCLRQLERHRTVDNCEGVIIESLDESFRKFFSPNEQSGRYTEFEEEFYIPSEDTIRGQHPTNKQKSEDNLTLGTRQAIWNIYAYGTAESYKSYEDAIDWGAAKEQARICLTPNIYTKRRLTGSFLNWANLLRLRKKSDAQFETVKYADAIGQIIETLWPKCYFLFEEYSLFSISLSRKERAELLKVLELVETNNLCNVSMLKKKLS